MDYDYFHPTDKETEAQRLGNLFDVFHIQPALEEPRFRPREHRATMSHCLPGYTVTVWLGKAPHVVGLGAAAQRTGMRAA